jgi:hypothetical protein
MKEIIPLKFVSINVKSYRIDTIAIVLITTLQQII